MNISILTGRLYLIPTEVLIIVLVGLVVAVGLMVHIERKNQKEKIT